MVVRLFKVGSLVLAILGVVVLLFAATRSQPPTVDVGNLRGTMNWAYVRIEGMVTRQPAYDPESRTLTLWVSDGTGEIMVLAYRSEAEALLVKDVLPAMGDSATLEGTLRIREDFQYLVLNVPDNVEVRPVEPAEMTIAAVEASPLYEKVRVRGVVRDDRIPYDGLRILTLRDATGEIDVTLSTADVALSGDLPDLGIGQSVSVEGAVDHYRGTPQISLGRGSDLVVLHEAVVIAPERRMGELSTGDVGSMATVEGMISRVNTFSSGTRCTLDDGTGTITLLLWQDLAASLPDRDALTEGALVRVRGVIEEYGGDLEVVPELPSDLLVLASPERVIPERQLGELNDASIGQTVRVEGALTSLRTFSAGVKGTLDDGTGTVTLLLWQDLYENLPDAASLVPGAIVRVEGEIRDYRGEREVVPQVPAGVDIVAVAEVTPTPTMEAGNLTELAPTPTGFPTLTTPESTDQPAPSRTATPTTAPAPTSAPTASVETRTIGAISRTDVGEEFKIDKAGIAGISYFSAGVKYTLTDATGSIILLLWQNVLEEFPDRYDLSAGSQVRVRGRIEEYQGELEIIPQSASRIRIVDPGERLPIEKRAVSDITPSDEGRVFVVEGKVARAKVHDWLYLWINDGTGEILIYVPERVVQYIPTGVTSGTRLRVTGEVDIYQGVLEIIPLAAADIEVR
jgi:DNA/RNA endonuclease YhcR with UshA esterase domain